MWHFIGGFVVGAVVWIPVGMRVWWRFGATLNAGAQAIETRVRTDLNRKP